MIDYIELINRWMGIKHYQILILIVSYLCLSTLDFILGSVNAMITDRQTFSSKTNQLGIIRKLGLLLLMILVIPFAMMLPLDVGAYSLTILYSGLALSEMRSVLAHLGILKDGDKEHNLIAKLFGQFFETITGKEENKDDKKL